MATPSQAPSGEGVETGAGTTYRVMAKVKAQSRPRTLQAAAQAEVVRDQESPGSSPGGATEKRRVTSVVARRFRVFGIRKWPGYGTCFDPNPWTGCGLRVRGALLSLLRGASARTSARRKPLPHPRVSHGSLSASPASRPCSSSCRGYRQDATEGRWRLPSACGCRRQLRGSEGRR